METPSASLPCSSKYFIPALLHTPWASRSCFNSRKGSPLQIRLQRRPARVNALALMFAGFVIPVGAALRAQTFAVRPAHRVDGNLQQQVLAQNRLEIQKAILTHSQQRVGGVGR